MVLAFLIGIVIGIFLYRSYARWMVRRSFRTLLPRRIGPLFPTLHTLIQTMRDRILALRDQLQRKGAMLVAYQSVPDRLPFPFMVVDQVGQMVFWNSAAARLFHLPELRSASQRVFYWMANFDASMQQRLHHLLQNPQEVCFQWEHPETRDTYEVQAWPLQRVPLQMGFLWINRSLEERLTRYKAEIITQLTHDLRTPVTTLWQALEIIRSAPERVPSREVLAIIERQLERLQQFVHRVEELHRMEQQEVVEPPQVINLSDVLVRVVQDMRVSYADKRLMVEADIEPGVQVHGWPQWLEALCVNLLDNAMKFTPPGRRVWVQLHRADGEVRLTVRDEGPGIPTDERERIFERFFRGRWAVQQGIPGSGLGLSLVRHIAMRHGGRIQVHSILGQGTEFVLTLPMAGVSPTASGTRG